MNHKTIKGFSLLIGTVLKDNGSVVIVLSFRTFIYLTVHMQTAWCLGAGINFLQVAL